MIDEAIQETACLYVLDLLSESEAAAFEASVSRDAELQKLVADLRNSAASLAAGISPRSTTAVLRTEILKKIANRARSDGRKPAMPAAAPVLREVTAQRPVGGGWKIGWAVAAMLAIICGLLVVERSTNNSQIQDLRNKNAMLTVERDGAKGEGEKLKQRLSASELDLAALKEKEAGQEKEIADLKGKEADALAKNKLLQTDLDTLKTKDAAAVAENKTLQESIDALRKNEAALTAEKKKLQEELADLAPTKTVQHTAFAKLQADTDKIPQESKNATALVAFDTNDKKGVLKLDKLAKLGDAKDYELWIIDGDKTVSCGVITFNADGIAEFKAGAFTNLNAFAISIEKKGGDGTSPKGPVIMVGRL